MDSAIIQQAYEAHREPLYGYLVSLTHDADAAQDMLQEAYARLAQEVRAGRTPRQTRAWLYSVGRNLVISRGRRQQVVRRFADRFVDDRVSASAEEQCLDLETRRDLWRALSETNDADRRALIMAAQGFSGAEIAAALGMSQPAVRTRMCRARTLLRARLAPAA